MAEAAWNLVSFSLFGNNASSTLKPRQLMPSPSRQHQAREAYQQFLLQRAPSRLQQLGLMGLVASAALWGLDVMHVLAQPVASLGAGRLALFRLPWALVPAFVLLLVPRLFRPRELLAVGMWSSFLFAAGNDWVFYQVGLEGSGYHAMLLVLNIITTPAMLPVARWARMTYYAGLAAVHLTMDFALGTMPLEQALALDVALVVGGTCLAWLLEVMNRGYRMQFFLRKEVEQALEALQSSRSRILTAATTLASSAHGLSLTLGQLSTQAASVRSEAERISEASMQMAASAGSLARTSRRSAAQADEAQRHTGHVDALVGRMEAGMTDISKAVRRSAQSVRELEESSERIGGFVEVIRELSATTTLLSLNASMEAARAGEHGSGFAVVAREVQRLAEESGRSSARVGEMVHGISLQMVEALQAVAQIGETTERFTPVLESARATLQSIRDVVLRSQEGLAASAKEADQQAEQIVRVSTGCSRLLELAADHARMSAEVAATARQFDQMADELRRMLPEADKAVRRLSREE